MKLKKQMWWKLERHRQEAASYSLEILILGPCDDGSPEYKTRCKVRQQLRAWGHNAAFGEELHEQSDALPNPIDDLTLQAESAHLIVMFYYSRGTQTERDVLLSNRYFADKSIIFVEESMFAKITHSVSSKDWKLMSKAAEIITYSRPDLPKIAVKKIRGRTEELRREAYARDLRYKGALK